MSEHYYRQRQQLLESKPALAAMLPENLPEAPAVTPLSRERRKELLLNAANNFAEMLILFGMGDGSLLDDIVSDTVLSAKEVVVFVFPGEEACVARFFMKPIIGEMKKTVLKFHRIGSPQEFDYTVAKNFLANQVTTKLAGADIIDSHPLAAPAEAFRAENLPSFMTFLTDRVGMYGDSIYDCWIGLDNSLRNADVLFGSPTLADMQGRFDVPVISIAAGPSLKQHLDELRALQDRCILVACDAVVNGLLAAGIEPHFCTPLERTLSIEKMIDQVDGARTYFCGASVISPNTVRHFHDRTIMVWGVGTLYDWIFKDAPCRTSLGQSTGVLSTAISRVIGTGPVYLVGHDLAFDGDATHWGGADHAATGQRNYSQKPDIRPGGGDRRVVPGNSGNPVSCTTWWDKFRKQIAMEALYTKQLGRRMYNVNAHDRRGAVIDHTYAAPLPDPASLQPIPWPTFPVRHPEVLDQWRSRTRYVADDFDAFIRFFSGIELDIRAMLARPPAQWSAASIAAQIGIEKAVPAEHGNGRMFHYLFNPAFANCMADIALRRQGTSYPRVQREALLSMKSLCLTFQAAGERLKPMITEQLK